MKIIDPIRVTVKTEKETNDIIKSGIIGIDGKPLDLVLDTSYTPLHHAKVDVEITDVGVLKGGHIHNRYNGSPGYSSGKLHAYPHVFMNLEDFNPDIQKGDKVYIHFNQIFDGNFLWKDEEGMLIYKVIAAMIFCSIRDGEIIPHFGHMLVKPYFEEAEDITYGEGSSEITVKGRLTESGLVKEINVKPEYLIGVVHHVGSPVGFWPESISTGERILFLKKSEFDNVIEGEEYYVMKQWDTVAKFDEKLDAYVPFANFVEIKVEQGNKFTASGIEILNPKIKPKGTVVNIGSMVEFLSEGMVVSFNERSSMMIHLEDSDTLFIPEQDILFTHQ